MGFLDQELTMTIKQSEYKELTKIQGKVESFVDFVKKEKYSISRETCSAILGFSLEKEDAGTDRE